MILFKPEHVQPILDGRKTETRRNWTTRRAKPGSIHKAKTEMLSKEFFTKIYIQEVFQQRLGDMSLEECKAELCDSLEEYLDLFWKINKKNLTKKPTEKYFTHFYIMSSFVLFLMSFSPNNSLMSWIDFFNIH